MQQELGIDLKEAPAGAPETEEELEIHMQLDYKQSIEIAEEELIENTLAKNKYDLTRARFNRDLVVFRYWSCLKLLGTNQKVFVVDYVDPANLVWSYTEDPNFEDIYYVGEVKNISLPELKKEFPELTTQQLEQIQKFPGNTNYTRNWTGKDNNNTVQVLYFEYKTYMDQVYKIKYTENGLEKALEKT